MKSLSILSNGSTTHKSARETTNELKKKKKGVRTLKECETARSLRLSGEKERGLSTKEF